MYASVTITSSNINIINAETKYIVDLGAFSKDVLIMYDTDIILSYDFSNNLYANNSEISNIIIDRYNFDIMIENNKIILTNTDKIDDLDTRVSISDFFKNTLEYLANNFDAQKVIGNSNYLTTSQLSKTFNIKGSKSNTNLLSINVRYSYENFDWSVKNYTSAIKMVKNSNLVTVSFSGNYSALNSYRYSLNGVDVYFGTIYFDMTQTATIRIDEVNLTNQDDVPIYLNLNIKGSNSGVFQNNYTVATFVSPGGISSVDFKGNVTIQAQVYSTYTLDTDDENSFSAILEKNNNVFVVNENISRDSSNTPISISLRSVLQQIVGYEDVLGEDPSFNIFISQTKNDNIDSSTGNNYEDDNYIYLTSYSFNDDQTTFLRIDKKQNKSTKQITYDYYLYYKDNGDALETDEMLVEDWSSIERINLSPTGTSVIDKTKRYITKDQFEKIVSIDEFDNIFKLVNSGSYIYLSDSSYDITSNYESYSTQIKEASYSWLAKKFDIYNVLSKRLSIDISDVDNLNITINPQNSFVYDLDNSTFNIILNSKDYLNMGSIKASYNENRKDISLSAGEDGSHKVEALTIILNNDISFDDFGGTEGFSLTDNTNIIGNGYYISFFGSQLYSRVTGTSFIKDLSLLGETYNKPFLLSRNETVGDVERIVNTEIESFKLNNVDLYGSVINYNASDTFGSIFNIKSKNESSNNSLTLSHSEIYLSINSYKAYKDNKNSVDLVLFNSSYKNDEEVVINSDVKILISDVKTLGILQAGNGKNGVEADTNSYDGTSGGSGGNVKVVQNADSENVFDVKVSPSSIIITGNGGNARGGKSSSKGVDMVNHTTHETGGENKLTDRDYTSMRSGLNGTGNYGGFSGNIYGFVNSSNLKTHSDNGYNSLPGARARCGFGALNGFNMTYSGYSSFASQFWGTTDDPFVNFVTYKGEESSMKTGAVVGLLDSSKEVTIEKMVDSMFNLPLEYRQKVPTYSLTRRI